MADELMSGGAPTSGQDPTAAGAATPTTPRGQGPATVPQAGDAGTADSSGTSGGHRSPSDARSHDNAHEGMTLEDALAALKQARGEAAENRRKAKELDDLKQQLEDAKLSETERLQKQLAELQREREVATLQAQERVVRAEVRSAAHELGLKAELALKLIDPAAIAFDEAGDPTNITELLQQAIEAYDLAPRRGAASPTPAAGQALPPGQPGVVARATPALGATNPPRGGAPTGQPFVRSVHDIQWKRG